MPPKQPPKDGLLPTLSLIERYELEGAIEEAVAAAEKAIEERIEKSIREGVRKAIHDCLREVGVDLDDGETRLDVGGALRAARFVRRGKTGLLEQTGIILKKAFGLAAAILIAFGIIALLSPWLPEGAITWLRALFLAAKL